MQLRLAEVVTASQQIDPDPGLQTVAHPLARESRTRIAQYGWTAAAILFGVMLLLAVESYLRLRRHLLHPLGQLTKYLGDSDLAMGPGVPAAASGREIHAIHAGLTSALQRVRDAESHFRTAMQDAPIGIYTMDLNGRCTFTNPAFALITGRECACAHTLDHCGIDSMVLPEDLEKVRGNRATILRGEHAETVEFQIRNAHGRIRALLGSGAPLRDGAGAVAGMVGFLIDVTDQHEVDEKLRQLNRDLEQRVAERTREVHRQAIALASCVEGMCILQGETIVYTNKTHRELFATGEAPSGDRSWRQLFHPTEQTRLDEAMEAIRQNRTWAGEVVARGHGGECFHAELELVPLPDGECLLVTRDITERKAARLQLEETNRFLSTVLDSFPLLVFWKNTDLVYTGCNSAFARNAGMLPEQVIGKSDLELPWGETEGAKYRQDDRELIRTCEPKLGIIEQQHTHNGRLVWVETNKVPLKDSQGNVIGLLGISQDITTRLRSESENRENRARIKELIDLAGLADWRYDAVTGELAFDNRFLELLGTTAEREGGFRMPWQRYLREFVHPEDLPAVRDAVNYANEHGNVTGEAKHRIVRRDGTIRHLHVRFTIDRDGEGHTTGTHGGSQDITDRIEYENTLRAANEELARTTRMKDEFMANMSHELRTPLNGILGLGEALREGIYGPLSDRQLQTIQRVEDSGRHLLELINDILDMNKMEAGRMELSMAALNIATIFRESTAMIDGLAKAKRVAVTWDVEPNTPRVIGDARRLRQVVLNVVGNAVKFVPSGGRVTCRALHLDGESTVRIIVQDTGHGIPGDQLSLLFRPFVQLQSPLTRDTGGTGLGLAISRRLVELHGGSISVSSEVGVGSTFTIILPCIPGAVDYNDDPPSGGASTLATSTPLGLEDGETPSVLIVDDDSTNVITVHDFLAARGFRCSIAANGLEAIEGAIQEQPDIILMDIQMPELDGLEATRRLRMNPSTCTIPVIAVTSFAMPGDRDRCIAAGCNEYMSKPLSLKGLEITIKRLLKQHAAARVLQ